MMIDPFTFALLSLATWRLSHMLSKEDGPGAIFRWLRIRLGAWYGLHTGWQAETALGKFIICPLCLSIWIGAALYGTLEIAPCIMVLVVVLAISGLACLLELGMASRGATAGPV